MAYDKTLAARIREHYLGQSNIVEKLMFGGIAFMQNGHMAIGVLQASLIARVGPDHYDDALSKPHVRIMDFAGRPMKGYVYVDPPATATDENLAFWINLCSDFVKTLGDKPAKSPKKTQFRVKTQRHKA
ncbi:MAG: TfoX/Sxy family protein [Anaerolineae bacterium]|nr:TfoX/Sxy family protein [Anaerolineae bacterium]